MAAKAQPRRYHLGFPDRVRRDGWRDSWWTGAAFFIGCLPLFVMFAWTSVAGTWGTWALLREEVTVWRILQLIVVGSIALLFVVIVVGLWVSLTLRIVKGVIDHLFPKDLTGPRGHHGGVPDRARRDERRRFWEELLGCGVVLLIFTPIVVSLFLSTGRRMLDDLRFWHVPAMIFLVLLGGFLLFFCAVWVMGLVGRLVFPRGPEEIHARIIPYFEKRVGIPWKDAPSKGHALARHAERLDAVAIARGVAPLSDLGLDDDLVKKPDRWRDPAAGLHTLTALREEIETHRDQWEEADLLLEEIDALREALERAEKKEIRFCLLISLSNDSRVSPVRAPEGSRG